MHRGLDRRPQLAACRIDSRNFRIGSHSLPGLRQVNRNENLLLVRIRQPFAGRFNPQNAVQLYRRISVAGLNQ
jgi:hypothetical protein